MFQQGDKVMIHGLVNKKELNDRFGILRQFDPDTQRWGVELTAFGTLTGKQLAIKPSNLRAAPPEVKVGAPVVGVPESVRRENEQVAFYSDLLKRMEDRARSDDAHVLQHVRSESLPSSAGRVKASAAAPHSSGVGSSCSAAGRPQAFGPARGCPWDTWKERMDGPSAPKEDDAHSVSSAGSFDGDNSSVVRTGWLVLADRCSRIPGIHPTRGAWMKCKQRGTFMARSLRHGPALL